MHAQNSPHRKIEPEKSEMKTIVSNCMQRTQSAHTRPNACTHDLEHLVPQEQLIVDLNGK